MTDFANLNINIDSTQAGEASRDLDRLAETGRRTEAAIDRLGDTAAHTGAQIKGAGKAASDMASAAQIAARATTSVGDTGKLSAHHMQNLAFQFQDLGVQMAMAAQSSSPLKMGLMALMQQGTQINGIMNQAGLSVGGLAKQMGGATVRFAKAHPILVALAVAAGAASGAFQLFQAQIDKTGEVKRFADGLGLTKKEMKELGPVTVTAGDAVKGLWKTISDGLGLESVFKSIKGYAVSAFGLILGAGKIAVAGIYAGFAGAYNGIKVIWSSLPSIIGEAAIGAANMAINGLNYLLRKSAEYINTFSGLVNSMLAKVPGLDGFRLGQVTAPQISAISNPYSGAGKKAGSAFAAGFSDAYGEAISGMDKFGATLTDNIVGAAKERLKKKADELIDERSGEKAAKKAGKKAGEAFAKEMAKFVADTWNGLIDSQLAAKELAASERAQQVLDVQDDLRKAQQERTQGAIDEADAAAKLNDELRGVIDSLDRLGGFGSTLGNIGAIYEALKGGRGDFSAVNGPMGMILGSLWNVSLGKGKNGEIKLLGEELTKGFDKVLQGIFGENGKFTNLLKGAGFGAATGQLLFGQNNKGAQIGGALGGALGQAVGGPIGNVIGSIIGSVIGGVFNKRPRGSGSVSAGSISSSANDASIKDGLDSFGLGLQQSIASIAQQLGGTVGAYSVGIGRYKDYYQVSSRSDDPNLGGTYFGKKSKNAVYDGLDAAAAMRAAILAAIEQGAIKGIREGAVRLLKAGKDIESQLAKALKFQGVFDELKAATDPLGSALDAVTKRFDELRTIFDEAGASAEEYAQLEQLLAIKRAEAADDARKTVLDKIRDPYELQIRLLELMGKSEDALAASRLLELAGMKAALQPLQAMVYQLEDARKVIDTFSPLADDLKKFRDELLGGNSKQSFGVVAAQFRAVALAAANGDATAMGNLRGSATSFLDAARANAGSGLEYRRALGTVLASVDQSIFAAETQIDYAQAQIDAVNNTADILSQMREEMAVLQTQIVSNTGYVANLWKRFEVDGLPVTTPDAPLQVEVVTP